MQIDIEDTLIRDIQAYMASKGITTDVGKYINTLLLEGFSFKKYEQFVLLKGRGQAEPVRLEPTPAQEKLENEFIKQRTDNKLLKEQEVQKAPVEEAAPVEETSKPAPRRRTGVKITKK